MIGSDGSLYLATPWRVHEPGIDLRRGRDRERFAIEQTNDYRLQSDNFSRAVRGLEEPLLCRADAFGQAHAIDALYRSAEAGGEAAEVAVAELPSAVSP